MKLAIFAFSQRGCLTAERVRNALCTPESECRCYSPKQYASGTFAPIVGSCRDYTGPVFKWADALVFVGAAGIAVRSVAPYVRDKQTDPAVLVTDELGNYIIPILSGHIGGANALAEKLALALQGVPVITTATDLHKKFSVDAWAARQGLIITDMIKAKEVSAAILRGNVSLASDFPIVSALPNGVSVEEPAGPVGILISCEDKDPFEQTLLLVPPILHLGIGCRRGTSSAALRDAVQTVLRENDLHPAAIKCAATIDLKRDEPGLLEYCRQMNWPLAFYSAEELCALEGSFTSSSFVQDITGVDNVCERAALAGADHLIVKKTVVNGVTVALAAENWEVSFTC